MSNQEWYGLDGRLTETRQSLHQRLIADHRAESSVVRRDRQAVIVVGPPGAGKSAIRHDLLADTQTGMEHWRHIDPDDFRDRLLKEMYQDGSIDQVVPPEVAGLEPTPRELSSQLFVESAKLAARAQTEAMARGDNLIIEGAYSDGRRLGELVKGLEKKGYDVHLAAVDVSAQDALSRVQARYRSGAMAAAAGLDALGGRFVPAEALAAHFDEQGRPKATQAARQVATERAGVQSLRQYTVAGADQPAVLASVGQREGGMQPVDAEAYAAARAAEVVEALPSRRSTAGQETAARTGSDQGGRAQSGAGRSSAGRRGARQVGPGQGAQAERARERRPGGRAPGREGR